MGDVRRRRRKKILRAHWGEDEPEEDPDPPIFLFEALLRINAEEAFFHACNLPSCPSPTGDPWDVSLHDYEILSRCWLKYPPPHLVAGTFVSRSDDRSNGKPAARRSSKKASEADAEQAYHWAKAGGIVGMISPKSRTANEQARFELNAQLVAHMKSGGKLADFNMPWKK